MTTFEKTLLVLAFLIVLVPFTGFPRSWEETFLVAAGLAIIALVLWRRWRVHRARLEEESAQYVAPVTSRSKSETYAGPQSEIGGSGDEGPIVAPPNTERERENRADTLFLGQS